MDTLGLLFGSNARVKVMRLFVLNPSEPFSPEDTADRLKLPTKIARRELAHLVRAQLIKPKSFTKEVSERKSGRIVVRKRRQKGFILNENYSHLAALNNFLSNVTPITESDIIKHLSGSGALKFVVIAGAFVNNDDARIDILIVGDRLKPHLITRAIKDIEARFGKELRYAVLSTTDFKYRLSIYDRLVRDIFDYPHRIAMDRFGITN